MTKKNRQRRLSEYGCVATAMGVLALATYAAIRLSTISRAQWDAWAYNVGLPLFEGIALFIIVLLAAYSILVLAAAKR